MVAKTFAGVDPLDLSEGSRRNPRPGKCMVGSDWRTADCRDRAYGIDALVASGVAERRLAVGVGGRLLSLRIGA